MTTEIRQHPSLFAQHALEKAIEQIPNGMRGAVVLYGTTTEMKFGVVAKASDGRWTFAGDLEKQWNGPWSATAEVRFSW